MGKRFAHRWDSGDWFIGKVKRKVTHSDDIERNGKYACVYPDSRKEFDHDLFPEDYGPEHMWVIIK